VMNSSSVPACTCQLPDAYRSPAMAIPSTDPSESRSARGRDSDDSRAVPLAS
jgi:hypothetical protein